MGDRIELIRRYRSQTNLERAYLFYLRLDK